VTKHPSEFFNGVPCIAVENFGGFTKFTTMVLAAARLHVKAFFNRSPKKFSFARAAFCF
jgi:hypothetical protein